jgi:hypothetical protein
MFNISPLLNTARIEKKSKNEVETYEALFDYDKRYYWDGCHKKLCWISVN